MVANKDDEDAVSGFEIHGERPTKRWTAIATMGRAGRFSTHAEFFTVGPKEHYSGMLAVQTFHDFLAVSFKFSGETFGYLAGLPPADAVNIFGKSHVSLYSYYSSRHECWDGVTRQIRASG